MKQAAFVLGVIATVLSTIAVLGVSWLYIEKKVTCSDILRRNEFPGVIL